MEDGLLPCVSVICVCSTWPWLFHFRLKPIIPNDWALSKHVAYFKSGLKWLKSVTFTKVTSISLIHKVPSNLATVHTTKDGPTFFSNSITLLLLLLSNKMKERNPVFICWLESALKKKQEYLHSNTIDKKHWRKKQGKMINYS